MPGSKYYTAVVLTVSMLLIFSGDTGSTERNTSSVQTLANSRKPVSLNSNFYQISMSANSSPTQVFNLSIAYNQFYIEPESGAEDYTYFQDDRENDQGFASPTRQAGIATPSETSRCQAVIELGETMPDITDAVQAVAFPLKVEEPGRLLLMALMTPDRDESFTVPPGHYDVVVRFFPMEASPLAARAFLRAWHVVLSFLPQGTTPAGTFKLEYGELPQEILLIED